MKKNNYLVKGYKEFKDYFRLNVVVLNDDGSFNREITINESKETMSKETLDRLVQEDSLILRKINADQRFEEAKREQALVKQQLKDNKIKEDDNGTTLRTISTVAILALLTLGGIKLVKEFPAWLNNDNNKTNDPNANTDNSNNNDVVTVEVVNANEQKKYYTEVDEVIFKEAVDSIIEEYAIQGFDADYKGVSATLFFANMQSIDASVVEDLIDAEYLENDFVQNLQAMLNFDSKVRHINNVYSLGEGDRFISVAPFAISNQKDYENILYSEELLLNYEQGNEEKHFHEYRDHISGPEIDSNYEHGYDDLTIGYRVLNKRFISLVHYFATEGVIDEVSRTYLLDYANDISEVVGFMNNYEGCFDNVPKTK